MKFSITKVYDLFTLAQPFRLQRSNFPGSMTKILSDCFNLITLHLFMLEHQDDHHCGSLVETVRSRPITQVDL